MSAPFRIERPDAKALSGPGEGFKQYLDRLLKMIPGEVVGIYMIGSGLLPDETIAFTSGWAIICLFLLIIIRVFGTGDPKNGQSPQQVPVLVAACAFVIWIFWLGGPFAQLHIPHRERYASLAVLVWSFVIPIFYKGPSSGPPT